MEQLSGKPLSYNNILDADCAMRGCALMNDCLRRLVIKHTTLRHGEGRTMEAYEKAERCDPVSAFGVCALARGPRGALPAAGSSRFCHLPEFDDETIAVLRAEAPSHTR